MDRAVWGKAACGLSMSDLKALPDNIHMLTGMDTNGCLCLGRMNRSPWITYKGFSNRSARVRIKGGVPDEVEILRDKDLQPEFIVKVLTKNGQRLGWIFRYPHESSWRTHENGLSREAMAALPDGLVILGMLNCRGGLFLGSGRTGGWFALQDFPNRTVRVRIKGGVPDEVEIFNKEGAKPEIIVKVISKDGERLDWIWRRPDEEIFRLNGHGLSKKAMAAMPEGIILKCQLNENGALTLGGTLFTHGEYPLRDVRFRLINGAPDEVEIMKSRGTKPEIIVKILAKEGRRVGWIWRRPNEVIFNPNAMGLSRAALGALDKIFIRSSFDLNGFSSIQCLGMRMGTEFAHKKVYFYIEKGVILWGKLEDGREQEFNLISEDS